MTKVRIAHPVRPALITVNPATSAIGHKVSKTATGDVKDTIGVLIDWASRADSGLSLLTRER